MRCGKPVRVLLGVLLTLAAVLVFGGTASAQDDTNKAAARRLAEEGAELYQQQDFAQAHDRFQRAYTLFPAPTLAVWEAKCLEKLDRLIEAEEIYVQVARAELNPTATEPYREAIAEATAGVERLRANIPTILIKLDGADPNDEKVRVLFDGKQLSPALIGVFIPVNPGRHTIAGSVRGGQNDVIAVDAAAGDRKEVTLNLGEPAPPPAVVAAPPVREEPAVAEPPEPTSDSGVESGSSVDWLTTTGWTAIGLGAAGIGIGIGTGLVATERHDFLSANCSPMGDLSTCDPEFQPVIDEFRTLKAASTAGYIAGGVLAAAGVAILVFKPSDSDVSQSVARRGYAWFPWVGGATGGVAGVF